MSDKVIYDKKCIYSSFCQYACCDPEHCRSFDVGPEIANGETEDSRFSDENIKESNVR